MGIFKNPHISEHQKSPKITYHIQPINGAIGLVQHEKTSGAYPDTEPCIPEQLPEPTGI